MPRQLPPLTGNYSVGFTDIIDKQGKDKCLMRLFYPTNVQETPQVETDYFEDTNYIQGITSFLGAPDVFASFAKWMWSDLKLPADRDGVPTDGNFPVVVFSHGLMGNRFVYSSCCVELASQGFVVAAVEHCDQSASATFYFDEQGEKQWVYYLEKQVLNNLCEEDQHKLRNDQLQQRSEECSRALDCLIEINKGAFTCLKPVIDLNNFRGKLDTSKCALLGHSFGGATMIDCISKDERFKVGVAMDVWTYSLNKDFHLKLSEDVPILFINSADYHPKYRPLGLYHVNQVMNVNAERPLVTIRGSVHQSQSDTSYYFTSSFVPRMLGLHGKTDASDITKLNNQLTVAFLRKHFGQNVELDVEEIVRKNSELLFFGSNYEALEM